jgi:hypothetical protein
MFLIVLVLLLFSEIGEEEDELFACGKSRFRKL